MNIDVVKNKIVKKTAGTPEHMDLLTQYDALYSVKEEKEKEIAKAKEAERLQQEADRLEQERLHAEYMQKKAEREKKLEEEEQLMKQHAQQQAESERQEIDAKKAEFKQRLGWDKAKSEKAWDDILQDKMMSLGVFTDTDNKSFEELEQEAREEAKKYRMPEARAESPDTEEEASGHDNDAKKIDEMNKSIIDSLVVEVDAKITEGKKPSSGSISNLVYQIRRKHGQQAYIAGMLNTALKQANVQLRKTSSGQVVFYDRTGHKLEGGYKAIEHNLKQLLQV